MSEGILHRRGWGSRVVLVVAILAIALLDSASEDDDPQGFLAIDVRSIPSVIARQADDIVLPEPGTIDAPGDPNDGRATGFIDAATTFRISRVECGNTTPQVIDDAFMFVGQYFFSGCRFQYDPLADYTVSFTVEIWAERLRARDLPTVNDDKPCGDPYGRTDICGRTHSEVRGSVERLNLLGREEIRRLARGGSYEFDASYRFELDPEYWDYLTVDRELKSQDQYDSYQDWLDAPDAARITWWDYHRISAYVSGCTVDATGAPCGDSSAVKVFRSEPLGPEGTGQSEQGLAPDEAIDESEQGPAPTAAPATSIADSCVDDPEFELLDETFEDADWSEVIVVNSVEPWIIDNAGQRKDSDARLPAGNPGPGRWIRYSWEGKTIPASVAIAHEQAQSLVPGPVGSVKIGFDSWASVVNVAPLLVQGETYYQGPAVSHNRLDDWVNYPGECLTAKDFVLLAGPGPATPDFSLPMSFGYRSVQNHTGAGEFEVIDHVVDNWQVQVWP